MSRLRVLGFTAAICILPFALPSSSHGQRIRADEYKIYSLVLRDVYKEQIHAGEERPSLVVLSETGRHDNGFVEKEGHRMKGLWGNLAHRNKYPARLSNRFPARYHVILAELTEIDGLIAKGKEEATKRHNNFGWTCGPETWTYFYKRFPGAYQYFQLSRVGYSSNGKYAVVEIMGLGDGSNSNWTHWLQKTRRGWTVYQAGAGFGSC